ncbi:MAG: FkbM family methyltransferase [Paracoccaceae bacterium]
MDEKSAQAMRKAFLKGDKATRQLLRPMLPSGEVSFADVRMAVNPRDNWTELQLWLKGVPPEVQSLGQLLDAVENRKALVLDIGANCGAYSIPLAKAAGAGARVLAFEPNPIMIGRLGQNVLLNALGQTIRIETCALGATQGEAELRMRPGNFGQGSLNPDSVAKKQGFVVPVRPLRPYLSNLNDYDLSVMKIDIEGGEEAALNPWLDAGIKSERPDLVLMETRHSGLWEDNLPARVRAFGYENIFEGEGNTLFKRL